MNNNVLFCEPGYEYYTSIESYQKDNIGYQNIVKYANIKYAMNDMISNPPEEFKEAIWIHFYFN